MRLASGGKYPEILDGDKSRASDRRGDQRGADSEKRKEENALRRSNISVSRNRAGRYSGLAVDTSCVIMTLFGRRRNH